MNEQLEQVGRAVLDSAFKVHSTLGPGLLESVYEAALAIELKKRGHTVARQQPIPVFYESNLLEVGFRADLVVDDLVLVELKSVEATSDFFKKVTLNYLKLIPLQLGFLINFNETHLRNGITRIVNGTEGKDFFANHAVETHATPPSFPSRSSRDTFSMKQNVKNHPL